MDLCNSIRTFENLAYTSPFEATGAPNGPFPASRLELQESRHSKREYGTILLITIDELGEDTNLLSHRRCESEYKHSVYKKNVPTFSLEMSFLPQPKHVTFCRKSLTDPEAILYNPYSNVTNLFDISGSFDGHRSMMIICPDIFLSPILLMVMIVVSVEVIVVVLWFIVAACGCCFLRTMLLPHAMSQALTEVILSSPSSYVLYSCEGDIMKNVNGFDVYLQVSHYSGEDSKFFGHRKCMHGQLRTFQLSVIGKLPFAQGCQSLAHRNGKFHGGFVGSCGRSSRSQVGLSNSRNKYQQNTSSSALHATSNMTYVQSIHKLQSISSLPVSQFFGHQKGPSNGYDMPLPVAVCSGLVYTFGTRKGKNSNGGLVDHAAVDPADSSKSSNSLMIMLPAGSSSSIPDDYVSAGLVLDLFSPGKQSKREVGKRCVKKYNCYSPVSLIEHVCCTNGRIEDVETMLKQQFTEFSVTEDEGLQRAMKEFQKI
ncbi:hypothetical protein Tco_1164265 [Tanacetum coccineum]